MASLALILCLIFILYGLRSDIQENRGLSTYLWIPFLWVALSASKALVFWLYPRLTLTRVEEIELVEGSAINRNFLFILICLSLIIIYKRRDKIWPLLRDSYALHILLVYSLVSVLWSSYPDISSKRWVRALSDVIIIMAILSEGKREAFDSLFRRCLIVLLPLSILFIRYYRYMGVAYSWDGTYESWVGVTRQKNTLGQLCAFGIVFLIWRISKNWPKINYLDVFLLLLSIHLLIGSKSATSLIVVFLGIFLLFSIKRLKGNYKQINRLIIALLIIMLLSEAILFLVFNRSIADVIQAAVGRDETFTGRTILWTELIKLGGNRSLLGAGFGGFWTGDLSNRLWTAFSWRPTTGHSGYVDCYLDLGIIGLSLLVFLIISTYRKITIMMEEEGQIGVLKVCFVFMIIVHNITESSFVKPTNFLWLVFLWAYLSRYREDHKGAPVALDAINKGSFSS